MFDKLEINCQASVSPFTIKTTKTGKGRRSIQTTTLTLQEV